MKKTKIAGAGISGLTCAIVLAKSGYKVEVFERSHTVGSRFHGDLQGLENFSRKKDILQEIEEYGIELNFPYKGMSDNMEIWTASKRIDMTGEKPLYYTVRRGEQHDTIDYGLYQQAVKNKQIKIKFNSPVKDLAKVDVNATGPVFKDKVMDGLAAGFVFETDYKDCGILLLDDDFAPDKYSYFLVMDGIGVSVSVVGKDFTNISKYCNKTYDHFKKGIGFKVLGEKKPFKGTGNMFIRNNFDQIAIGEAGGFQDILAGFGMRYAIQSGYLAAKSIIEGISWEKLVKKHIHPFMKASVVNRFLYNPFGDFAYNCIAEVMKEKDSTRYITQMYQPNIIHRVLYPMVSLLTRKNIRDPQQ